LKPSNLVYKEVKTPIGVMAFGSSEKGLCLLDFRHRKSFPRILKRITKLFGDKTHGSSPFIELAETELNQYLQGDLKIFSVPLDIRGSEFQLKVWNALLQVPYGRTASYLDIAQKIGRPEAVRAVANANGQNGIAVIIPCHRVIGSDGSLTGYGGGVAMKKRLLNIESKFKRRKITDFI
jgi:AraC family transcriptional regulator of adaptative response/methylated-DNA-[protein]-cysteine methyltransferase